MSACRFGGTGGDSRRETFSNANRPVRLPWRCWRGVSLRPARGRIDGSVHHFVGGTDRPFRFELGECFLILIPAPINVAVLMDGSRRPEKLVQALSQQHVG